MHVNDIRDRKTIRSKYPFVGIDDTVGSCKLLPEALSVVVLPVLGRLGEQFKVAQGLQDASQEGEGPTQIGEVAPGYPGQGAFRSWGQEDPTVEEPVDVLEGIVEEVGEVRQPAEESQGRVRFLKFGERQSDETSNESLSSRTEEE